MGIHVYVYMWMCILCFFRERETNIYIHFIERRKWQPTPVFLPGEFHGERSLVGYSSGVTKSLTRLSN